MDSLSSILAGKQFDEPNEIASIKSYVLNQFKVRVGVQVRTRDIIISVPSAAAANTLRLNMVELKRQCHIDKRLTFRIDG